MKFHFFKLVSQLFLVFASFIFLQQNLVAENVPPPPPLPTDTKKPVPAIKPATKPATKLPGKKKKRSNRPEVTIVSKSSEVRAEYRINDILYMIKVSPKSRSSRPYYLVDQHGDGVFVRSNFKPKNTIPKWALKRSN